MNSTAGTTFSIDVFASTTADPTGYGEGQRCLGTFNVTTDGSGNVSFTQSLSASVAVGEKISATATRSSTPYDTSEFAQCITAAAPGISVTPTSGLTTTEAGGTAQFSVVLTSASSANVTIGISSSDTTEGTVSTTSLTFTTANWMTPQTVTVTGVDDYIVDGDVAYTVVTAAAVSADGNYSGLNASDVSVTNTDNDTFNTIYVDTNSDTSDGDTSSIAALYAGKGLDGKISLREAITAANNTSNGPGGPDRIYFNIDGTGVHTISPGSALPNITSPVIIDGYTQHGASVNTLAVGDNAVLQIELNGTGAGSSAYGLTLDTGSSGSTISGLVINRFSTLALFIENSSNNNIITGNFIGTTADGTAASPNSMLGMQISTSGNHLGGDTPAARNVICGGITGHIPIVAVAGTNNTIQGNYIGTNAAGTAALSPAPVGIQVARRKYDRRHNRRSRQPYLRSAGIRHIVFHEFHWQCCAGQPYWH